MSNDEAVKELADMVYARDAYERTGTIWFDEQFSLFLERNIVIPRTKLPQVHEGPHSGYVRTVTSGGAYESAFHESHPDAPASDPEWHRNHAWHHIALAEWLEAWHTEQASKNAARDKRRDELAKELSNCGYLYMGAAPVLRDAIDRIIDLEAACE